MVYIFFALITVVVVIIKERKHLKPYQMVVFGIYTFAPFIAGVFTVFVYGLSISAGIVVLVLLLMYCMLNISQSTEKAIADRDLKVASAIQENMLPKTFPFLPDRKEFDIYATMTPAKEVGGDFYDFFMIDDDHLGLVIADVSGKGVPAALFMVIAKTLIKNRALVGGSPSEILAYANNQLLEGNDQDLFVTVWLGIFEISTGKGIASNAGHEHPVIKRAGGDFELEIYRHSLALAVMEDVPFEEHEFKLNKGDTLVVYTDGVPEAANSDYVQYGTDRMLSLLNKNKDVPLDELLANLRTDMDSFVGDAPQFDDITMLALKYNG
jgi:serine phosphatase RsbU (regulator of sigma subunit)